MAFAGRRREEAAAHGALAAVIVVWAGAFPAVKTLLEHGMSAGDIALVRYLLAAPGFALVYRRAGGLPGLDRSGALRLATAGLLVVVGYHVSLNAGTRLTTSGTAALVVALAPGITLVLAHAIGLERLLPRRALGLAVAFAGVVVVVVLGTRGVASFEGATGPAIVLGAALSFASYNVLLKALLDRHGVLPITAAASLLGTAGLIPLARGSTVEALGAASVGDLMLLLYLGLACTLCGYVAWNLGLQGLGASRAVSYTCGIPLLAVALGAVLLGEPITPWLALGGVLVVGGVAVAQKAAAATEPLGRQGAGAAVPASTSRTRPRGSRGSPSP